MNRLSPRNARSNKAICSLRTDNMNCKKGWIMIDGPSVVVVNQVTGNPSTSEVSFSRSEFNKLIDWYNRPQATHKR